MLNSYDLEIVTSFIWLCVLCLNTYVLKELKESILIVV